MIRVFLILYLFICFSFSQTVLWSKPKLLNVREKPSLNSKIKTTLWQGTKVFICDSYHGWYLIKLNQTDSSCLGWAFSKYLSNYPEPTLSDSQRRQILFVKSHPLLKKKFKIAILNGLVEIGMTREMVIASLGYPDKINTTRTKYAIREQFIYGEIGYRFYIYLKNGIVTSIQD